MEKPGKTEFLTSILPTQSQELEHKPVDILENVALAVFDRELEGQGCVVTLQDGGVIIEDGELAARIAQERVGPSRVVHIVDCGSNQGGHLIQLIKASLGRQG